MKVYVVSYSDNESGYPESAWYDKEKAEVEAERLNKDMRWASTGYYVEEFEVQ